MEGSNGTHGIQMTLSQYETVEFIGQGGFGTTYKVTDKEGNSFVLKQESNLYASTILFESFVMKELNRNQVRGVPTFIRFKSEEQLNYMIMTFGGISLQDYMEQIGKFQDKLILDILRQAVLVLKDIHKSGYVHRDLKPQNMLIDINGVVNIIDFGLSIRVLKHDLSIYEDDFLQRGFVGTVKFCPIAAHNGIQQTGRDDLESLCYTLIYLSRGQLPWQFIRNDSRSSKLMQVGEQKKRIFYDDEIMDSKLCKGCPKILPWILRELRKITRFSDYNEYDDILAQIDKN